MDYAAVKPKDAQERAAAALEENGIHVVLVENGDEAKKEVLEMIPRGAEVMTMTSQTLEAIGLDKELNDSGAYASMRKFFETLKDDPREKKRRGAAPEWAVGSVHAITEDGSLLIASATGSQLPSYAYGADHVVWVAGAQKLVKNVEEGKARVYEHVLPLEDARARKAYGSGSGVNKLLIFNKEVTPNRVTLILVNEALGF